MARFGLRVPAGGIEISLDGTTVLRHLPPGAWVHLWSAQRHVAPAPSGRNTTLETPLGQPPVLYREGSGWADLVRTAAAGTVQPVPAPP